MLFRIYNKQVLKKLLFDTILNKIGQFYNTVAIARNVLGGIRDMINIRALHIASVIKSHSKFDVKRSYITRYHLNLKHLQSEHH